jgi:hypothetical protein
MKDITGDEHKLKVIEAAMKRAKEIAEAEAAQFSVWQKMQERETLRAEMLKKAREKKKRREEEIAARSAAEEAATAEEEQLREEEDEKLARRAEEALVKAEEWEVEQVAQGEEARKAAARERLARVEEKLRRAEERMAAKAKPRPRRGLKKIASLQPQSAEPTGATPPSEPAANRTTEGDGVEKDDEGAQRM